ncbi:LpqB family beta-propeller domain-containing protein [Aeromicrobium sp.]|uniref:LpqB family beta-propeller domain-containing protein n=1 Tax=Aeromicrobium sp. TaxID=1871063 RepID=UPI0030BBE794
MISRRRHDHTARSLVVAVVTLVTISACAGIPTSGPVTRVADDGGFGESTVRYSPSRPIADSTPQQVVRGYLDAMLAYPQSSGTASAFLTPEGAKGWSPTARVRVYSAPSVSATLAKSVGADAAPTRVDVRLSLDEEARLDRQGHYTRRDRPSDITYRLERIKGEWRIANPQVGLLVSQKFFGDYFRPFDIFYFDRPGRRLVPDPVYRTVGDQLATGLVSSLVRGPGPSAEGTPRSYLPPLDSLRPSVPVSDDGVADVEFDTDFSALSESVQDHLSAQIVWTLRQVPDVTAVRLLGGTTVLSNSGSTVQDIDSWAGFGPNVAPGHTYAIARDKVVQIDDDRVEPLTGAWGENARGAVFVGVSDDGVAGVLAGRSQVRITNRKGTGARTFGGSGFIAPRWDGEGAVWLLDRPGSQTRVRVLSDGMIRTLDVGGLAALAPSTFALSPDASRYAVTIPGAGRDSIQVGRVLRDADDRILGLGGPARVFTGARSPRAATWSSGTELSYLAESRSGRQIYSSAIDGSSTIEGISRGGALLPDVDAGTLAIGPDDTSPRYATDARKRLWYLPPGESWQLLSTTGVTGLTYGR